MSAISNRKARPGRGGRRVARPRAEDPRVVRSRAALVDAARTLFLRKGYAGTTMEEIAALAGLTKRTVYNNYSDKNALFTQIVADVIVYAEEFARGLSRSSTSGSPPRISEPPSTTWDAGSRSASCARRWSRFDDC